MSRYAEVRAGCRRRPRGPRSSRARFRLLVSRKRLVGTLALVLLAGLATRYARDRPGQSVLIGHSIDRSTIAYQLSAASPEEIKELVALQRSLGKDAISVDKGDGTGPFASESTRAGVGAGRGRGGGDSKSRSNGGGGDGLDDLAGEFDTPERKRAGGTGAGNGASADAVGDGSCDAALEDKIRAVEKQAQRWQSMVLQRAQEHADAAAAKACHGDRHVVAPEPEAPAEEKKSSILPQSINSLIGAAAANFATKGGSAMLHHTVVPGDASVVWQREVLECAYRTGIGGISSRFSRRTCERSSTGRGSFQDIRRRTDGGRVFQPRLGPERGV